MHACEVELLVIVLHSKSICGNAYSLAKPAFLTAVDMALMAVKREFNSKVKLPVAPSILLCSFNTKRVSVMESTSISPVTVAIFSPDRTNPPLTNAGVCIDYRVITGSRKQDVHMAVRVRLIMTTTESLYAECSTHTAMQTALFDLYVHSHEIRQLSGVVDLITKPNNRSMRKSIQSSFQWVPLLIRVFDQSGQPLRSPD